MASELRVGVNHLALDEERIRQEQFFQGILDLEDRLRKVGLFFELSYHHSMSISRDFYFPIDLLSEPTTCPTIC